MKLLTIIIPTFNMEAYLGRCLDSLLIDELESVEVLVVNDGSTDRSSALAHSYADRFPHSIKVIDKANGHYGSCINAALKLATGKYVRILDADDCYNSDGFQCFVSALDKIDADVVFSRHAIYYADEQRIESQIYAGVRYGETVALAEYQIPQDCLRMHCLTFRTQLVREMKYRQTEGICYTDNEFVMLPLLQARNFYAVDAEVYQYRIGRDEQSVSLSSMIRNASHYMRVTKTIIDAYFSAGRRSVYPSPLIIRLLRIVGDVFTLYRKPTVRESRDYHELLDEIKQKDVTLYRRILNRNVKHLPLYKLAYKYPAAYYALIFPIIKRR